MPSSFNKILIGTIFFVLTIVIAVVGYLCFGWTLLEAIYMVVITIFGVGYGEVKPIETAPEKIFTILVIIAGTSSAVYIVGGFVQLVAEGEINRALDTHRKGQVIQNLNRHTIICGFGRMGQILARQLQEAGQQFVIVDRDNDSIVTAEQMGYLTQVGNATDENILQAAGIDKAKVLATVLPDDAANVFITLTARGLNPKLSILARGELPTTEKKLKLAGADRVVLPATISAMRMANLIIRPTAIDFLENKDERNYLDEVLGQINVQIDELSIASGSPYIGQTISRLEIQGKGSFIIVALCRQDGTLIKNPQPGVILAAEDRVILMGHQGDIPRFAKANQLKSKMRYRGSSIN
ncbi:MAG TPA: potassium channel family protein [Xenococcaceae cyanobacterium]